jgi:hypothetical protein
VQTLWALGAVALNESLTTVGYSGGPKATIDVTNLIWLRASIKSLMLFAQSQAAWADAWDVIVPSASMRCDQTDRGEELSAGRSG